MIAASTCICSCSGCRATEVRSAAAPTSIDEELALALGALRSRGVDLAEPGSGDAKALARVTALAGRSAS